MDLIEFKNLPDTSTPLNADNLNHNFNELNNGIEDLKTDVIDSINELNNKIVKSTELYNTTGNNANTLTLNESIDNFTYYEVFYKVISTTTGDTYASGSVKAFVDESAVISENVANYFKELSCYGVRVYASKIIINDTKLTHVTGYNITLKTDNTMIFDDTRNEIFITKVIGYK